MEYDPCWGLNKKKLLPTKTDYKDDGPRQVEIQMAK